MNNIFGKYRRKGNISIMIILVLLASSLMAVLTMNFLKQMFYYTTDIYFYHKSYYFSKAGLELALAQINNAGAGFSYKMSSEDLVFANNFDCKNCELDMEIIGNTQYLSDKFWLSNDCNDATSFNLNPNESIVIPMFLQKPINSVYDTFFAKDYDFSLLKYRHYLKFIQNQDYNGKINLGFIALSGQDVLRDYLFVKTYETNSNIFDKYFSEFDNFYGSILDSKEFFAYIVLSNTDDENLSFCVHLDTINQGGYLTTTNIAANSFFVFSLGNFMNRLVGLQAIYRQPLPSFMATTYLGVN